MPKPVIERKALQLLSEYGSIYGQVLEPPMPVELIAEQHLGLIIDWDEDEFSIFGEEDRVLAFIDPSEKRICINPNQQDYFEKYFGTEVFTLGHEIGHWILHVDKTNNYQLSLFTISEHKEEKLLCRGIANDNYEIQANMFSAALLMPFEMLRQDLKHRKHEWPTLFELKDKYHVTISAMKNRVKALGWCEIVDGEVMPASQKSKNQLMFNK